MEEKKGLIKTKKQMFIVIGVFTLVMLLGTVTYAFFNYTRTGSQNIIKTGRIYFNSEQGTAINLTNLFPVDPTETGVMDDATKVGTVTINVVGDTTYSGGIEYLVSAANVQNSVGSKSLPISIQVSVEDNNENDPSTSLGTVDADYFTNRGTSAQTSIYKVLASDVIENNNQLVVGYIKSGQDGVDGNIVIKAYIDKNKIAISDTYPEETIREVVENYSTSVCETALTGVSNASTYCASSEALEGALGSLTNEQLTALVTAGVLREYTNGTPASFGEGRTVLTTTEWNSLQTNGVSFQVKVEANEGVWVEEPANGTIESCPNCKFIYTTGNLLTTWNIYNQSPTVLTSGYSTNYNDIVTTSGKNYFLGVVTNASNQITNAYACGIYNGTTPFCIEGTADGANYSSNSSFINGANLWNNTCTVESNHTECGSWDGSSVSAIADSDDTVVAGVSYGYFCGVYSSGEVYCYENDGGE